MPLSVREKHITIPPTPEGIREATNWLYRWRDKIKRRAEKLIDKMLQEGETFAFVGAAAHIYTGVTIDSIMCFRDGNHGILMIGGNVVWVEFGTGVVANNYNPYPHHKAQELGMNAIGTYGKGNGSNPNGWWYTGDDGQIHHTFGHPSDPFFYNTAQMLRREYDKYAKEIFSKP